MGVEGAWERGADAEFASAAGRHAGSGSGTVDAAAADGCSVAYRSAMNRQERSYSSFSEWITAATLLLAASSAPCASASAIFLRS